LIPSEQQWDYCIECLRYYLAAASVAAVILVFAFASDMVNLFEATPSSVGEGREPTSLSKTGEDGEKVIIDLSTIDMGTTQNGEQVDKSASADVFYDAPTGEWRSTLELFSEESSFWLSASVSGITTDGGAAIDQPPQSLPGELIIRFEKPGPSREELIMTLEGLGPSSDELIITLEEPGMLPEGEELIAEEAGWMQPLEYSLLGVVVALGGVAIINWRAGRKRKIFQEVRGVEKHG
jgi:hypothetical protein